MDQDTGFVQWGRSAGRDRWLRIASRCSMLRNAAGSADQVLDLSTTRRPTRPMYYQSRRQCRSPGHLQLQHILSMRCEGLKAISSARRAPFARSCIWQRFHSLPWSLLMRAQKEIIFRNAPPQRHEFAKNCVFSRLVSMLQVFDFFCLAHVDLRVHNIDSLSFPVFCDICTISLH